MSVVLVTATQNFIIFMSDGRVQSDSNGIKFSIQEDYKKLKMIGSNICVGYTGSKALCEKALNELYNPNAITPTIIGNQDINRTTNILCSESKMILSESSIPDKKISFIIGGRSNYGKIEIYTFGSKYNFEIKQYIPQGNNVIFAGLYPEKANGNELEKYLSAITSSDKDSIKKAMSDCIDEIADLDDSVNKNKFTEVIECDYYGNY